MIIDAQINTLKMQRWCWIMSRFPGRCKDFSLWGVFTIWHTSRSILLSSFIYLWLYTLGKKASVLATAVKRPSLSTNQTLKRTQIDPHTEICLCFCPTTHTHTCRPASLGYFLAQCLESILGAALSTPVSHTSGCLFVYVHVCGSRRLRVCHLT